MSTRAAPFGMRHRRRSASPVLDLTRLRIERALRQRSRYRYVRPRVEREGAGWRIVSPNCSRSVDPGGGEIAIAWLVPGADRLWQLHAHDDARGRWVLRATGITLMQAMARICVDPTREYWR